MSRISISASQKPKPKETFKFLRRDEGRLSYSASVAESPSNGGTSTQRPNADRRDSRALREAIAYDMKHAKSSDPFGDIVIAVPKKAPPPNLEAATADKNGLSTPASKRVPPRLQSKSRPEWVNPEVPIRRDVEPPVRQESRRGPSEDYDNAYTKESQAPTTAEYQPYSNRGAPVGDGRRGFDASQEDAYESRDMAGPPRRTASAPRRYADPHYDDYDRNYFRRPAPAAGAYDTPPPIVGRSREEESLMLQLEQEVRSAQEERARYTYAKQQLDREKQRFDSFRYTTQQQLDDERAELDAARAQGQRAALKEVKALEERYRSVSGLLSTEREANRKLMQENDTLRAQLEETTASMREQQKVHKAETGRLHREIESLTMRNSDLLAMARDQQIQHLENVAAAEPRGNSVPTAARGQSRGQSTAPAAAPAREPSFPKQQQQQRQASPVVVAASIGSEHAEDGSVDGESVGETLSNGERPAPVVMDFSPRGKSDPARARRAREMAERMRREEEEMQRRRQHRERATAERQTAGQEEGSVPVAREEAEEKERGRSAATAAQRRKESAAAKAREEGAEPAGAAQTPLSEAAKARKAAGHPLTTPRVHTGAAKNAASTKKAASAEASAKNSRGNRFRIPTREELIGDAEEMPMEDYPNDGVASQTTLGDNPNKREILYQSGKREIHYANGTRKVVLPSGHTILHFTNSDVKCTYPSGKSTYWYDAAQTTHTQSPDGVQVFEFNATGQTERHLVDGTKEILYPDGIFKVVKADGSDETFFPDDS